MNTKTLVVVVLILVVLGGGYLWMKRQASTAPETMMKKEQSVTQPAEGQAMAKNAVEIKDFAYNPKSLTVKVGDTVTWTNKDLAGHSVTADDKSFDLGVLSQNESGSFTFTKAGTFAYHCTPHPNIQGTIVVEP